MLSRELRTGCQLLVPLLTLTLAAHQIHAGEPLSHVWEPVELIERLAELTRDERWTESCRCNPIRRSWSSSRLIGVTKPWPYCSRR